MAEARVSGSTRAAAQARARRRRVALLSVLLAAAAVGALVNYGVFGPVPRPEIPEELHGAWISDDPRYAGRRLEFDTAIVSLRTGDSAPPEVHPVYDVRRQEGAGVTRYAITYREGRDGVTLGVLYRRGTAELELASRRGVIWRRE